MAILVVDGGWCACVFTPADYGNALAEGCDQGKNKKFTIVGMVMDAKTGGNEFIFDTVEPGRVNQCRFLCPRPLKDEAEAWLDRTFNGLLMEFGAEICREMLGGEAHVRKDDKIRPAKQIHAYLKN